MAKYEMQDFTLSEDGGREPLKFPRILIERQVSTDELVRQIARLNTLSPGDVVGCLRALHDELARFMAEGCSVEVEGLGLFTPALGIRPGKERESSEAGRRNASSIVVKGVHFKAESRLVQEVDKQCRLERSTRKFRRSSTRYNEQERLRLAQDYLSQHPRMTLEQYCQLTGLLKAKASRELKGWTEHRDETGITTQGRGPAKAWIRHAPGSNID